MPEQVTYHRHTLRDVIDCSIMGWEDKPLRLPKYPAPLDEYEAGPAYEAGDRYKTSLVVDSVRTALLNTAKHLAPDGGWIARADLLRPVATSEKVLMEALRALESSGKLERNGRVASVYYRLPIGEAPPVDRRPELVRRLEGLLSIDWVTPATYAERTRMSVDRIRAALLALHREGLAEVRAADRMSDRDRAFQTPNGLGKEYRASRKLLMRRMVRVNR